MKHREEAKNSQYLIQLELIWKYDGIHWFLLALTQSTCQQVKVKNIKSTCIKTAGITCLLCHLQNRVIIAFSIPEYSNTFSGNFYHNTSITSTYMYS